MAGTVTGGLARIEALAFMLERYIYLHAARADPLRRLEARDAAAGSCARSGLAGNAAERALLERRLTGARD